MNQPDARPARKVGNESGGQFSRVTLGSTIRRFLPESIIAGLRAFRQCRANALRRQVAERQIRTLVARSKVSLKLNLGSGPVHGTSGWTTLDAVSGADVVLDLAMPLPFPDNSVAAIYSSHLIEHFALRERTALLLQCRRILRPGGSVSVAVPNARIYLEAYLDSRPFDFARHPPYEPALHYLTKIDLVNYIAYMDGQHHHLFDEENVLAVLRETGFRNVRLRAFDPGLDTPERRHESIYAIAEK